MSMEAFVLPISPSRKRPAPDDDLSTTSSPSKMAKSSPVADQAASTPSTSPKQVPTTPKKAISPPMSALTSPAMTLQPPTPLGSTKGSTKGSVNGTTASGKKKKKTKQEIEEEKKAREAEKESKRLAAEEKKKLKDELDQIRNEEKRKKAEELEKKRKEKEHEKAEKQREKDLKAQAKEEEKQKKIDEQNKKERAQLRMGNFFAAKPSAPINRMQVPDLIPEKVIESSSPKKSERTSYETFFLPFYLPSHTTLPANYFDKHQSTDDEEYDLTDPGNISSFPKVSSSPRTRQQQLPVEEIFNLLQGTSQNPIDLTSNTTQEQYALELLEETPMKYLHFEEDVRPPYFGTWTKPLTSQQWRQLARNPAHNLEILDYDYDSEAEWEEPEEGEDLVSEDGEEEDDGDDNMSFIDDEESAKPAINRGFGNNDLVPICSGLQWEDGKGNLHPANGGERADFSEFSMEFLIGCVTVDPFSTEYWTTNESSTKNKSLTTQTGTSRPALVDKTKQTNGVVPNASTSLKQPRMVPNDELDQFKAAIAGQDLTKIAMIEHLKKMFPKSPKDAIVNTLAAVAERESKKSNAKWRLKGA